MSNLLNKRLARSLWRTKLRLLAVIFMVSVGVFAGLTFGGYSHNLSGMYDTMHDDSETGANLADLWIDNRTTTWSAEEVAEFCDNLDSIGIMLILLSIPVREETSSQAPCFTTTAEKRKSSIHYGTVSHQMPTRTEFGCPKITQTAD